MYGSVVFYKKMRIGELLSLFFIEKETFLKFGFKSRFKNFFWISNIDSSVRIHKYQRPFFKPWVEKSVSKTAKSLDLKQPIFSISNDFYLFFSHSRKKWMQNRPSHACHIQMVYWISPNQNEIYQNLLLIIPCWESMLSIRP